MCVSQLTPIREETRGGKVPLTVLLQTQRHSCFQDLLSWLLCMWDAPQSKRDKSNPPCFLVQTNWVKVPPKTWQFLAGFQNDAEASAPALFLMVSWTHSATLYCLMWIHDRVYDPAAKASDGPESESTFRFNTMIMWLLRLTGGRAMTLFNLWAARYLPRKGLQSLLDY